jgi:RimJ/RimL family protein N-acetyltransferase
VTLKLLTQTDGAALFSATDRARAELVRWFEWPDRVTSPEAAKDYIAEIQVNSRIRLWWLIYENGVPVGGVQMRLRDGGESVSLPYWLVPEAQGRGWATMAVREVLDIARRIGFLKAKFLIAPDNTRSAALASRLGFARSGEVTRTLFRDGEQASVVWEKWL